VGLLPGGLGWLLFAVFGLAAALGFRRQQQI